MDVDALDEGAHLGDERLVLAGAIRRVDLVAERRDHLAIAIEGGGVERDGGRRRIHVRKLGAQLGLLGLHGGQASLEGGWGGAVDDAIHNSLDGARHLIEAAAQLVVILARGGSQALALGVVGADELGDDIGREQMPAQRVEHARLEVDTHDGAIIVAILPLAPAGAAEPVTVDNGVAGAAAAAMDEPAHQVARRARPDHGHVGAIGAAILDAVEDLALDDGELRRLGRDPFAFGIEARDALAGRRVLHEALPVPDDLADIEAVLQDAVLAGLAAGNCRCIPLAAARPRDLFGIERAGDLARGAAGQIIRKYAADGFGLGFDDGHLASRGGGQIAEGAPSARSAGAHTGALPAPRLLREIG